MAIGRKLDSATGVLHTTISGVVTIGEMREHFSIVRGMEAHACPEIIDARGVAALHFGVRDLTKLAAFGRDVFGAVDMAPRAVVVSGVVHFGIARLFAAFSGEWVRIQVFDDAPLALAWLFQFPGPVA